MNNSTASHIIVVECHHVSKAYRDGDREVRVLDNINFKLLGGESVAIMGASGSGKSTLLNLLGGLDKPGSGEIFLCGHSLAALPDPELAKLRNRHLGFVYQMHHLLMEFSAVENVAMPLWIRGMKKREAEAEASAILERVGLSQRLDHKPHELSGGERQRVAIARALVTRPSCVLMDEPTGNLDVRTAESVWLLIEELQRTLAISFVVVTHDARLAHRVGKVWSLVDGQLLLQVPQAV